MKPKAYTHCVVIIIVKQLGEKLQLKRSFDKNFKEKQRTS